MIKRVLQYALTLLTLLCIPAWAADYCVGDCTTGAYAATYAAPGDVVWGASGVDTGDTLYIDGTLTAQLDVQQSDITITVTSNGGVIDGANLLISDESGITVNGVEIKNDASNGGLDIRRSSDITVVGVYSHDNEFCINLQDTTDSTVDSTTRCEDNDLTGMKIQGAVTGASNLTIAGTYARNGATSGDGDGIGIGHAGGTMTNINIVGARLIDNGPRSGSSDAGGGITVSTSNSATAEVNIRRCYFEGNYRSSINLADEWIGGVIAGNVIVDGIGPATGGTRGAIHLVATGLSQLAWIVNNTIDGNTGYSSGIRVFGASPASALTIVNNSISNQTNGSYVADINLSTTDAARTVKYNNVYSPAGNTVAREGANTYATVALWDDANGDGGHIDADPLFIAPGSDYRLRPSSTLRRAGTCYLATGCAYPDYRGYRGRVPPDIGAYQRN